MPVVSDLAADLHTLTARLAALGPPDAPPHIEVAAPTETFYGRCQIAFAVAYGKLTVTYWNDERSACWRVERYEIGDDGLRLDVSRRVGAERGRLTITAADAAPAPPATTLAQWRRRIRSRLTDRLPPGTRVTAMPLRREDDAVAGWRAVHAGTTWLMFSTPSADEAALWRLLGRALAAADAAPTAQVWLASPPDGAGRLASFLSWLETHRLTLYEAAWDATELRPVAVGRQPPLVMQPVRRWERETPTPEEVERLRAWFGDDLDAHCEVASVGRRTFAIRWYGLTCAQWRRPPDAARTPHTPLCFGLTTLGERLRPLTDRTRSDFQALLTALRRHRTPAAQDVAHPLYRAHPERWLDAVVRRRPEAIDDALDPTYVYGQSPHFGWRTVGLADVLTLTRTGRLAVLELKTDADADLIRQGLTYWRRALHHWRQGDFVRRGYFAGARLDLSAPPQLYLVAPTLRFHPVTYAVARRLRADVPLTLVGVNEQWRRELRVVFRERFGDAGARFPPETAAAPSEASGRGD